MAQTALPQKEYERLCIQFETDLNAFFAEMRQRPNFRVDFLLFAVRYALELYPLFVQKNISDTVYFDTFSDIAIWADNYRKSYGEAGIDDMEWVSRSLQMGIFRLGRLQFEPTSLLKERHFASRVLPSGTLVLNIHIPQGSPLTPNEFEASYRQALSFFRGITPVFFCHSWLLYPALADLLPAHSNIRAFQSRF